MIVTLPGQGYHSAEMIRAILLIFDPAATWERIAQAQRGVYFVLLVYLLPLLAITLGVEAFGLVRLGEARRMLSDAPAVRVPIPTHVALQYAGAGLGLYLAAILLGARVAQKLGNSFHSAHSYRQAFATVAYGLGPYFLCRMLDGLPPLNTWLCFAGGVALSIPAFYHGVPQVMKPDPARAFGLFISIFVLCVMLIGIVHFLTVTILHGQFLPAIQKLLERFGSV